ncbi:hypothetical protein BJI48_02415 [Helicobacter sp. 11S02596-1]|nr:hypothetical protein BJI48_02415 [Helicobacter sp. 11S02596-1]
MSEIKNLILMEFHRLTSIEIVLFLAIFVIFIFIFTLGLVWHSKRFLPTFLFLLSFVILFSSPFLIRYVMKEKIYKIEVSYQRSSPLQYANAFLIDMDIKNLGMKNIHQCIVKIDIHKNATNTFNRFKNMFFPTKSFKHFINEAIPTHQSRHFVIMIDDFYDKHSPYKVSTDCF